MSENDLPELVRSFLDEELVLEGDIVEAARANMVAFRLDPERFDAAAVGQALVDVGSQLTKRLAGVRGPVTFYAWYDEQAGQLRCSVACTEAAHLPFGRPCRPVDDPRPLLDLMAADDHPGLVLWAELDDDPGPDIEPDQGYSFPVFTVEVVGA